MKYVSIDIETTGLNPETCQILSFGAIIEDTNNPLPFEEIPKFYKVFNHKFIQGEPFALNMNSSLIKEIKEGVSENLSGIDSLSYQFWDFLYAEGFEPEGEGRKISLKVAGKNFQGFDMKFLDKVNKFNMYFKVHQRVLDPASLFVDFKNDEWLPNLFQCKERADMNILEVSHNALEDAWDVIQVLRTKY